MFYAEKFHVEHNRNKILAFVKPRKSVFTFAQNGGFGAAGFVRSSGAFVARASWIASLRSQ